jgi:hypothetical protein
MNSSEGSRSKTNTDGFRLTSDQIDQINEALSSVSEYGEVHLVIQRGVLKYINILNSHKAWQDENKDADGSKDL